jgi:hypothetical protein
VNARLFPMEFTFVRTKMRMEGTRACRPPGIGRNHEHKVGFRRDRGCLFRNVSDLRVVVLAGYFFIIFTGRDALSSAPRCPPAATTEAGAEA